MQIITEYFRLPTFRLGKGACHSDEIFLQFRPHAVPFEARQTQKDHATSRMLVDLWVNFAETGNPTPRPGTESNPALKDVVWEP